MKQIEVFGSHHKAVLALLSTPKGAGSVYLLIQHKLALGMKTIPGVFTGFDG